MSNEQRQTLIFLWKIQFSKQRLPTTPQHSDSDPCTSPPLHQLTPITVHSTISPHGYFHFISIWFPHGVAACFFISFKHAFCYKVGQSRSRGSIAGIGSSGQMSDGVNMAAVLRWVGHFSLKSGLEWLETNCKHTHTQSNNDIAKYEVFLFLLFNGYMTIQFVDSKVFIMLQFVDSKCDWLCWVPRISRQQATGPPRQATGPPRSGQGWESVCWGGTIMFLGNLSDSKKWSPENTKIPRHPKVFKIISDCFPNICWIQ